MCYQRWSFLLLARASVFFLAVCFSMAHAAQMPPYVPDNLAPWEAWVMHDHKEHRCPHKYDQQATRVCRWPTALALDITSTGATFRQTWHLYNESWVVLPGEHRYWPKNVQVVKTDVAAISTPSSLAVVNHNNKPSVLMAPGRYEITGEFRWRKRPKSIAVPPSTGLIALVVDGQAVASVNKDKQGRLWFAKDQKEKSSSKHNAVTARVFRKVMDGVPVRVETRVELDIAGVGRELLLGRMQLPGFETITFESPLPARVEDDGQLRVQVKPGRWQLTLTSRQVTESADIAGERLSEVWPEQEIWSFVAQRQFRTVKITGVLPIDPGQTGVPDAWKTLPTYVVSQGDVFRLEEKIRGDVSPDGNKLSLQRHLWLDFDGGGFTVKDEMRGDVQTIGRLSAHEDFSLGRVGINGIPQVVTHMGDAESMGVEVRPGEFSLEAVGRIEQQDDGFSAIGWTESMESLSVNLQLPPGWMLVTATGADAVRQSWVSSWSLWHVFIFLVTVVCTFRIFNGGWAVVVALALLLVHNVDGAPWSIAWLCLLALYSVLKVVPDGRWQQLSAWLYRGILLAVVLSVIPFAINQVRQAIYPQLEYPHKEVAQEIGSGMDRRQIEADREFTDEFEPASLASVSQLSESVSYKAQRKKRVPVQRYDVNTKIQTGPGVPQWQWNRASLYWSGPVTQEQQVTLWLVGPMTNRMMNILRVLFIGCLLVLFIRNMGKAAGGESGFFSGGKRAANSAVGLLVGGILLAGHTVSTDAVADSALPTPELLATLEKRLLAPSACLPHCAAISEGRLSVNERSITLHLTVNASKRVAVPLPVEMRRWQPTAVLVNGEPAVLSHQGGQLMVLLDEGRNDIQIAGRHQQIEQLNFPFTLVPHNIELDVQGWEVTGYVKGQVKGRNIQLTRIASAAEHAEKKTLLPTPAPAFVTLERTLDLDIEWRLTTRIVRVAPERGPINLSVPLLEGESLVTDLPVDGGNVLVSLRAKQPMLEWQSIIQPRDQVRFLATPGSWSEVWNVLPSQRWHVDYDGILPIKQEGQSHISWWPITGEQVTLRVNKPAAVEGRTLTLQSVDLLYEPGARATKSTLSMVMRSSVAGEYSVTLPGNVEVESVTVDGERQVRADDSGKVTIPVKPGEHVAQVRWLNDDGARINIRTPVFDLLQPASNVRVRVEMPRDRWTIFVGGPSMGPALLFWGVALVIIGGSLFLGRASWSILRPYEWALLGLGIATTYVPMILLIIGWFFAMHWRKQWAASGRSVSRRQHSLIQVSMGGLTLLMLLSLLSSVASSLVFGHPEMQISGNGSSASALNWYQDRTDGMMPSGWVISLPMGAYRLAMLVWSLWLAFALLRWLRWGWACFSEPMPVEAVPEKPQDASQKNVSQQAQVEKNSDAT